MKHRTRALLLALLPTSCAHTQRACARDAIAEALAPITRSSVLADVRAIERPRHHAASAVGLEYAATFIEREFLQANLRTHRQRFTHQGRESVNVIAERAGANANAVVLVAAHYDTVHGSPGADDNASGIAGLLALARASQRVATEATLRLIAFGEEENGLGGSTEYVRSLSREERARIRGAIVMDMIGYTRRGARSQEYPRELSLVDLPRALPTEGTFLAGISLVGEAEPRASILAAQRYTRGLHVETLALPRLLLPIMEDMSRSDHAPFWQASIPAITLTDTANFRSPHYHQASDTSATLDQTFVTQSVRLAAAAALILARPAERSCSGAMDFAR